MAWLWELLHPREVNCGHNSTEKHMLPMNFNFLPCHFVFYDSIFIFGILETPPKSLASFRLIFVFIPIFRIFNIKKLLKITSRARIHFPLSSYDFFHFSLPTHKKPAQNVKVEFCPPRQLLPLHCSGCGAQIALRVPWPLRKNTSCRWISIFARAISNFMIP